MCFSYIPESHTAKSISKQSKSLKAWIVPMAGVVASSAEGRRIVVAIDESEESLYALSWCLSNITRAPAADSPVDTLILLYARPVRVIYPSVDGTGYMFSSEIIATMDNYGKQLADALMVKAKRFCSTHNPNVKVETKVEIGDARDVICEAVAKLGADMLVMGSHGYGLIKRAFLGSVSNHCAQNVKCPVVIVKKPKH